MTVEDMLLVSFPPNTTNEEAAERGLLKLTLCDIRVVVWRKRLIKNRLPTKRASGHSTEIIDVGANVGMTDG